MNRVKELESVNDKIKMILAAKREPYQPSTSTVAQRISNSHKREAKMQATPKRMTSLFQNENIVESKVGPQKNYAH